MMCARRQAIVVTGGGSGSGNANSTVNGPVPGCPSPVRGRTFHAGCAGSQRYSSSDRPAKRGRSCLLQCHSSCSDSCSVQSIVSVVMARTVAPATDRTGLYAGDPPHGCLGQW